MIFTGQFVRELPHRLVFFKAAFAKTFSPAVFLYRDQLRLGGIHMRGDKTGIFLTLLKQKTALKHLPVSFQPSL